MIVLLWHRSCLHYSGTWFFQNAGHFPPINECATSLVCNPTTNSAANTDNQEVDGTCAQSACTACNAYQKAIWRWSVRRTGCFITQNQSATDEFPGSNMPWNWHGKIAAMALQSTFLADQFSRFLKYSIYKGKKLELRPCLTDFCGKILYRSTDSWGFLAPLLRRTRDHSDFPVSDLSLDLPGASCRQSCSSLPTSPPASMMKNS